MHPTRDPFGLDYMDFNFTSGTPFGAVTIGVQSAHGSIHPYLGGGYASWGPAGSVTYSKYDIETGVCRAIQGASGGAAAQIGSCGDSGFWEAGTGTTGASGTVFYVFPDVREYVDSAIDWFKCLFSRKC